jgi:hypothetical protein
MRRDGCKGVGEMFSRQDLNATRLVMYLRLAHTIDNNRVLGECIHSWKE